jgi:AraC family transcriptional regulator
VLRVRDALENTFPPPSLSDLARLAGAPVERITRVFRRFFRVSPAEYARRRRLERACRALAETDEDLAKLALVAGYCDQSHLNRDLRRRLRVTPLEYRARFRSIRSIGSKTSA